MCLLTGDTPFGQSITVMSVKFLLCKVTFFPL